MLQIPHKVIKDIFEIKSYFGYRRGMKTLVENYTEYLEKGILIEILMEGKTNDRLIKMIQDGLDPRFAMKTVYSQIVAENWGDTTIKDEVFEQATIRKREKIKKI